MAQLKITYSKIRIITNIGGIAGYRGKILRG